MFQSNHYQITSSRLPPAFDGCRIAHLSDLHGESHGTENQDLLRAIFQFQPDFTVLTGDMVGADSSSIPLLLSLCKRLRDLAPVYFIEGNHEQTMDKEERNFLLNSLSDCGLTILSNDTLWVSPEKELIFPLMMSARPSAPVTYPAIIFC